MLSLIEKIVSYTFSEIHRSHETGILRFDNVGRKYLYFPMRPFKMLTMATLRSTRRGKAGKRGKI
jgi:hypothetical protein